MHPVILNTASFDNSLKATSCVDSNQTLCALILQSLRLTISPSGISNKIKIGEIYLLRNISLSKRHVSSIRNISLGFISTIRRISSVFVETSILEAISLRTDTKLHTYLSLFVPQTWNEAETVRKSKQALPHERQPPKFGSVMQLFDFMKDVTERNETV